MTLFDAITNNDLILAFFSCIYFETIQQMYFQFTHLNQRGKTDVENIYDTIERLNNRTRFHTLLLKLVGLCKKNNLRLIIENPATEPNYLITGQNFYKPSLIDKNRMLRGDYFKKPTAYWYFNCEPTYGESYQNDKKQKNILDCKQGIKAGICSEERSMISSDYARNFICDFILGKEQSFGQGMLF